MSADFYTVAATRTARDALRFYWKLQSRAPDLALATHELLSDERIRGALIHIAIAEERCDLVDLWIDYPDERWLLELGSHFTRALLPVASKLLERNVLTDHAARELMGVKELWPLLSPLVADKPYGYLESATGTRLRFLETTYDLDDPRILWEYLLRPGCSVHQVRGIMERHAPELGYAPSPAHPTVGELAEVQWMAWTVDPGLRDTMLATAVGHSCERHIRTVIEKVEPPNGCSVDDSEIAKIAAFFRRFGQVTVACMLALGTALAENDTSVRRSLLRAYMSPDAYFVMNARRRLGKGSRTDCAFVFARGPSALTNLAQERLRELA